MLGLVDTSNVALVKMLTTGVLFNVESAAKDLFAYYGVAFTEESFGSFGKYAQMSPAYVPSTLHTLFRRLRRWPSHSQLRSSTGSQSTAQSMRQVVALVRRFTRTVPMAWEITPSLMTQTHRAS
eukprot:COSAG02_NODE_100_length_36897_cov_9.681749_3_plen_124_part_00